ncbi:MAG: Beta-lactamase [uncultured Sulfurovum sp.]|uniref:Beta-lactamase n=1 Tax=uncultured Sulfurovum sp. TaxID=269237 RepID=A0A6S6TI64_9BACT|nr:MAG: Beta-lactamase [uncultured Sulfurovum sp.]
MIKEMTIGLLSIVVLAGCGSENNSTKKNNLTQTSAFDKSSIDIIFRSMEKFPTNVQVSIAKIEDGQVYYYGALHSNSAINAVDNYSNTFMIGSISKVFTSTLLAQMVLDNKITLDESIGNQLPYTLKNNINMSYKQLANHTSGVTRDTNVAPANESKYNTYHELNMTDIEKYLKHDLKLEHEQGTHHYSNLGMNILGYMMTEIENKSYETLLQERILNKLGMDNTTTIREQVQPTLIPALMENDDSLPVAYDSAGGIHSSVEDLYKFALASFGDEPEYLLTQEETVKIDNTESLGLGWFINTDVNAYFHGGATQGYRSIMILDKENHNGIIVLSNVPLEGNIGDIHHLGFTLMEEIYK